MFKIYQNGQEIPIKWNQYVERMNELSLKERKKTIENMSEDVVFFIGHALKASH